MPPPSNQKVLVGVDVGGTKILAGVFTQDLQCLGRSKMSTKAGRGAEAVINRVARCVQDVVDECDLSLGQVAAVGVGAPGAVDSDTGKVIFAPNLGWRDVPLRKHLEKALDCPVHCENDGNVCALGVWAVEHHAKPRHLLGIFLGTGIGAGLIINGQLYSGFSHTAGEAGHTVLDITGPKCSCGNYGCWESLAGRQALFRKVQSAVKDGQKTLLTDMLGPNLSNMRSGDLRKAIRKGDKYVAQIVEEAARYSGIAIGNLVNLLNPEIVVLGGGLIDALEDEMMPAITETARKYSFPGATKGLSIVASKLGDDAGIVGAAVLARNLPAQTRHS